jgi:uncharacterized membrane protein (DUF106 family)
MSGKNNEAEPAQLRTAKAWFGFCLAVATICWIAAAVAGFLIPVIHPDLPATIGLVAIAVFLAIIAGVFSLLALTGLVDWRLMRKQQPRDA